ncbi:MAG: RNA polymerase sigma factor [Planctomycetota bacterium]
MPDPKERDRQGIPREEEDAVLVTHTIRGNEEAAAELFRRYVDPLFGFIFVRVGRDRGLAEDITQDVFFEAWRNLDRFRTDARFPAWLVGIAKRKLAKHFRKPAVKTSPLVERLFAEAPGPESTLEAEELALAVTQGLTHLHPDARRLLLMKYRDGLSQKEIAARLGTSPEAVNSRLQRARLAFKKALQEGEGDETGFPGA